MTTIAPYLLKVILCSGVLFLYYHLALRNKVFHQWNRFYLLLAVVFSMTLPLLQFTLFFEPENESNVLQFFRGMRSANEYLDEFVVVAGKGSSPETWIFPIYALTCSLFLLFFLFSLLKIAMLIRRHTFQSIGKLKLTITGLAGTPFSFLHFIFWNKDISMQSDTGQQIFQHEVVHAKEKHTWDKLFLQTVLAFYWFNPFFWVIRKELWHIHEFIADKKAVGEDDATAFANMVLQSSYPQQFSSFISPFFQTSIKRRFIMLTKKQSVNYAGRVIALPLITMLTLAFAVRMDVHSANPLQGSETGATVPENKVASDTIPDQKSKMTSFSVNTDKTITIRYADGKSQTMTEQEATKLLDKEEAKQAKPDTAKPNTAKPLYFVDGKEFTGDLNTIDPMSIESVNVLKGPAAVTKYGDKGKNGVVEITSKKGADGRVIIKDVIVPNSKNVIVKDVIVSNKESQDAIPDGTPIFDKTEVPASIDKQTWREFLSKNLQPIIEHAASKGAKPGTYTINIRFLVKKDGSVSDFVALNDPGYDFDKKILDIMPNSPKWKPAEQNGKLVNSYHTQPITFVIQEM